MYLLGPKQEVRLTLENPRIKNNRKQIIFFCLYACANNTIRSNMYPSAGICLVFIVRSSDSSLQTSLAPFLLDNISSFVH